MTVFINHSSSRALRLRFSSATRGRVMLRGGSFESPVELRLPKPHDDWARRAMETHEQTLERLALLPHGWDADGEADAPTRSAIERARTVLREVVAAGLTPEIGADAMGGVALEIFSEDGARDVWIAIGDNGHDSVIFNPRDGSFPAGERLAPGYVDRVRSFLAWPG